MSRKKRIRLAKGIYRDNIGYAIVATHKGHRIERRKDKSLTLAKLKAERETLLSDLKKTVPEKGSLKDDIHAYLKTLRKGRAKQNRDIELNRWKPLHPLPRYKITPRHVVEVMDAWTLKPSSQKKAITALKAVWRFRDGVDAPTPLDDLPNPQEAREVRDIPPLVVAAILRNLPPSKTRARLKVLARTGLPHKQIAQIQPHHLDLAKRELTVAARQKGAGAKARTLPLTRTAVRAFKEFQRMKAFGPFSRHSMRKTFRTAVEHAKATWADKGQRWPAADDLRPYDLRHAFATEAYRRTKDVRAVGEMLLHADWTMAARYAEAAVSDTAAAVRDALDMPRARATKTVQRTPFPSGTSGSPGGAKRGTAPRPNGRKGRK